MTKKMLSKTSLDQISQNEQLVEVVLEYGFG